MHLCNPYSAQLSSFQYNCSACFSILFSKFYFISLHVPDLFLLYVSLVGKSVQCTPGNSNSENTTRFGRTKFGMQLHSADRAYFRIDLCSGAFLNR